MFFSPEKNNIPENVLKFSVSQYSRKKFFKKMLIEQETRINDH